jgi:hypothetical protein
MERSISTLSESVLLRLMAATQLMVLDRSLVICTSSHGRLHRWRDEHRSICLEFQWILSATKVGMEYGTFS